MLSVEQECNCYAFTPIPPIPDLGEYKLPVVAIHISTIMDSIAQEIRSYYETVPTVYVPFYNDEGVAMPPSPEQHNISSISQLSYFSVSFLFDDSHDLTGSPEFESPRPLSQPHTPIQHIPINDQLHSPLHEILQQSPSPARQQQPESPVQQIPTQIRVPSPVPVNHEPVVHQSPSPVHHPHVPIQQRPQMLPDNIQEPTRIIEGYKANQSWL